MPEKRNNSVIAVHRPSPPPNPISKIQRWGWWTKVHLREVWPAAAGQTVDREKNSVKRREREGALWLWWPTVTSCGETVKLFQWGFLVTLFLYPCLWYKRKLIAQMWQLQRACWDGVATFSRSSYKNCCFNGNVSAAGTQRRDSCNAEATDWQ